MEWVAIATVFTCLAFAGIRVVAETERVAVHQLGRFVGFRSPGIRFRMPGRADVWSRIGLGARGEMLSADLASFGAEPVPVESASPLSQGQFVLVEGFSDSGIRVALDANQVRVLVCARCGHENPL